MTESYNKPPKNATRLLLWFLPALCRSEVVDDFEELYTKRYESRGVLYAIWHYWRDVFSMLVFRPFRSMQPERGGMPRSVLAALGLFVGWLFIYKIGAPLLMLPIRMFYMPSPHDWTQTEQIIWISGKMVMLGLLQWILLRHFLRVSAYWVVAGMVSAIAFAFMISPEKAGTGNEIMGITTFVPVSILIWITAGFPQWLVLRNRTPLASWWLPVGLAGSLCQGILMSFFWGSPENMMQHPEYVFLIDMVDTAFTGVLLVLMYWKTLPPDVLSTEGEAVVAS